jgi:ribonuclease-3
LTSDEQTAWLTELLPHPPKDMALYQRALTHGSTGQPDYQRLEFLGDRILGLIIADMLYHRYKDEAEGRLSHRLNALVSGGKLAFPHLSVLASKPVMMERNRAIMCWATSWRL